MEHRLEKFRAVLFLIANKKHLLAQMLFSGKKSFHELIEY